jgi:hypothetical protein
MVMPVPGEGKPKPKGNGLMKIEKTEGIFQKCVAKPFLKLGGVRILTARPLCFSENTNL